MNTLFVITNDSNSGTNTFIKQSCEKENITYKEINEFAFNPVSIEIPEKGDMLYRVSTSETAQMVEKLMYRQYIGTFYSSNAIALSRYDNVASSSIIHEQAGIPIPATIFSLTTDRSQLQQIVKKLGGFPIILKLFGGQHGVGVMKLDSFSSLYSVVDVFVKKGERGMFRTFIASGRHTRVIVLGNEAIDAIVYHPQGEDFRSNVGENPVVEKSTLTEEVAKLAIRAVQVLGFEFGGVDVITDTNGNHFVMEVNFPCFFPRCQRITGTDISGKIVRYLKEKSLRLASV